MPRFIILCIVFLYAVEAFSQPTVKSSISGTIIDSQANEPVEFANVMLHDAVDSLAGHAVSGQNGTFILPCVPGTYYLKISFVGYESFQSPVFTVASGESKVDMKDILLAPSKLQLSEVEIVGKRKQIMYRMDKKVIEASGYISASGGTAKDILEHTPSIRVDAEGNLTFRGSSGFKVYIDGKPGLLDGSAALDQVPASQIESIEVMTTPSAKHSPDGSVGIINIVTKKQSMDGWSGVVNGTASSVLSRGIDFLAAHKKENVQWLVGGYATRSYRVSDFDQTKNITIHDTITSTQSTGERKGYWENYSLKTGFEYTHNKTTYNIGAEGGYRGTHRSGDLHYEDSYRAVSDTKTDYASYNGSDLVDLHEWFVKGSAGFDHRFVKPGHKLSGSYYIMYGGDALEYFQTDLYDLHGKQEQGHKAWEAEYRWTSQGNLDYFYPMNDKGGKIEAGYQFYSYMEDGDYTIQLYNPALTQFVYRDDLYCAYLFKRDIHSLYAMLANNHGKFGYQLGLREEYTHQVLESSKKGVGHVQDRFEFFPSVHLSYTMPKGGRTSLSYSRRTTRPELFFMEPYVVYVDYYTAQEGNPDIRPEYINAMEAGYLKSFKDNSIAVSFFHRTRKDKIERIRVPYHTGVTLDSMANVGNDYSSGAELTASVQCMPWWTVDANGSLYYYKIKNEYKLEGEDEESWNWQLGLNNSFDVAKNTRVQLEGYYVGPSVSTQGRVNDFYYVNLSARQSFFKRKLAVTLSARNLLSTAKYISNQSGVGLESFTKIYPRSPLITMTVSFTFNNYNNKKKDEKSSHDLFEGTNR